MAGVVAGGTTPEEKEPDSEKFRFRRQFTKDQLCLLSGRHSHSAMEAMTSSRWASLSSP